MTSTSPCAARGRCQGPDTTGCQTSAVRALARVCTVQPSREGWGCACPASLVCVSDQLALAADGGGALLLGLCPTDVDIAMRRSKEVPGPGKYPVSLCHTPVQIVVELRHCAAVEINAGPRSDYQQERQGNAQQAHVGISPDERCGVLLCEQVPIFKEILSRTTLVPSPACYAPVST